LLYSGWDAKDSLLESVGRLVDLVGHRYSLLACLLACLHVERGFGEGIAEAFLDTRIENFVDKTLNTFAWFLFLFLFCY
jgi:hypothetical protein